MAGGAGGGGGSNAFFAGTSSTLSGLDTSGVPSITFTYSTARSARRPEASGGRGQKSAKKKEVRRASHS
jgi:hypothetical protein